MKELLELILNKLENLEEENKVNGSDVLFGISLATEIVEECFEEFEKSK